MKNSWKIFLTGLFLVALSITVVAAQTQKNTAVKTVVFDTSIHCQSCQKNVESHIPFEKGVKDVVVDLPKKQVTVKFDSTKTNTDELIKAFAKINITAKVADTVPATKK